MIGPQSFDASKHFLVRVQQRGLCGEVVGLLKRYGARQYDGHGGVIRYFDKRSRKQIERDYGAGFLHRLGHANDAYLVESACDGGSITAGHRYKRLKRK